MRGLRLCKLYNVRMMRLGRDYGLMRGACDELTTIEEGKIPSPDKLDQSRRKKE